jgi:4-hydroxy-3-polyprenylbenzoate decarboxylase
MAAHTTAPASVTLAFTGASGMPYGLRLLECLLSAGVRVDLLISQAARIVAKQEMALTIPGGAEETRAFFAQRYGGQPDQLRVFGREDWSAPAASGSSVNDAMVICPCSMGTLGAVAAGLADNLIERAADVMLKEHRPLLLVPRETPLSVIHLENMLRLARAGAVVLPPNPGFYTHPQSIAQLVDFVVARVLDQLGVAHQLVRRWGQAPNEGESTSAGDL